jgi:hypothetical protein
MDNLMVIGIDHGGLRYNCDKLKKASKHKAFGGWSNLFSRYGYGLFEAMPERKCYKWISRLKIKI